MLAKENQPISETCKNKPEFLLTKKMLTNEKAKNLKKRRHKKTEFDFLNSTIKRNLRIKDDFAFCFGLPNGDVHLRLRQGASRHP